MSRKHQNPAKRNPVAKFATRFHRAVKFRDRTKYRRKPKHQEHESFPLPVSVNW